MRQNSGFTSQRGQCYIYSPSLKKTSFVHPVIHYLFTLDKQGTDLINWFENIKDFPHTINKGEYKYEEIKYNIDKYLFLKDAGYFKDFDIKNRIGKKFSAKEIKNKMANVNHVIIEVTDNCNLNCEYCGYGKYYEGVFDERIKKDLDIDIAKNFIDNLVELWNSSYNSSHGRIINISFYGGEPLLKFPFIKEMVSYMKSIKLNHNQFNYSISTNGVLLDKYIDYLSENEIGLAISLDGDKFANSYRVFHNGKESFEKIIKNINYLKETYPEYYQQRVNFCSVLHNRNSVGGVYDYFKNEHNVIANISELKSNGLSKENEKEFWNAFQNLKESFSAEQNQKELYNDMFVSTPTICSASAYIHRHNDFCFNNYNDLIFDSKNMQRSPTRTCVPFGKKIFITVNGKLLPCETVSHKYFLGTVTKDSFQVDFDKIASLYNNYFDKITPKCEKCFYTESCNKCIFDFEPENDEIKCDTFMHEKQFSEHLAKQLDFIENNPDQYFKILEEAQYE